MSRLRAIHRSWGACRGKQVFAPRHHSEWLGKIAEVGVHRRAAIYYQQFNALRSLCEDVRRDRLAEAKKHRARNLLGRIPFTGQTRAALSLSKITSFARSLL